MTEELTLTQEELNTLIEAKVEERLSSKEEAEARQEAEQALEEAKGVFEKLKADLEARDAKIAEYEKVLANFDSSDPSEAEVAANERIVELEGQIEKLTQRANVAEAALETLAREETAASRMAELEEAGVALEDNEAEKQYAKVRDMDDESFDAYKSELIALKGKFTSSSEEEGEDDEEIAELSNEEILKIAQTLGCDPEDSKCISLVQEVAKKVSEVSQIGKKVDLDAKSSSEESEELTPKEGEKSPQKETASTKLSLGEAITKSMDQEIRPNLSLREEAAQAWEDYRAEKRGEKKNSE